MVAREHGRPEKRLFLWTATLSVPSSIAPKMSGSPTNTQVMQNAYDANGWAVQLPK
jgi:hypothetical protein